MRNIFFDLVAVARVSGIYNGSVAIGALSRPGAHRITSRVKGRYVVWNYCCIVVSSHGTTESIFRVDTHGGCARLLLFHNWTASRASHHSCLPARRRPIKHQIITPATNSPDLRNTPGGSVSRGGSRSGGLGEAGGARGERSGTNQVSRKIWRIPVSTK